MRYTIPVQFFVDVESEDKAIFVVEAALAATLLPRTCYSVAASAEAEATTECSCVLGGAGVGCTFCNSRSQRRSK